MYLPLRTNRESQLRTPTLIAANRKRNEDSPMLARRGRILD